LVAPSEGTLVNDELFERILIPIAGPDDAEATARAVRPHLDPGTTLIVTHVTPGEGDETTIKTGRDEFAGATYDTFFDILYRDDLSFEWVTLEAREVAAALVDAIGMTDATLVAFTPRDIDDWKRTITGDPGGHLIRAADVPVMVFPDRRA
jgi:nucleotide-binding universal stress UspA family protein